MVFRALVAFRMYSFVRFGFGSVILMLFRCFRHQVRLLFSSVVPPREVDELFGVLYSYVVLDHFFC